MFLVKMLQCPFERCLKLQLEAKYGELKAMKYQFDMLIQLNKYNFIRAMSFDNFIGFLQGERQRICRAAREE